MSEVRVQCLDCGCPAATDWVRCREWTCPMCGSGFVHFTNAPLPPVVRRFDFGD